MVIKFPSHESPNWFHVCGKTRIACEVPSTVEVPKTVSLARSQHRPWRNAEMAANEREEWLRRILT